MTLEKAKKIIKSECYIADLLDLDRTQMVNTALDTVSEALSEEKKEMPLICLRCKKDIPLSMPTFKEISYTHYSYCEDCLRRGLKALRVWDEVYQQIYDHHYEILKEEASEGRNAKLSLSNWVLDLFTGYDIESEEAAEEKPKTGHWIAHGEHCENLGVLPSGLGAYEWCSECDCGIDVREWHRNNYNYCPNCGAKMAEGSDEE